MTLLRHCLNGYGHQYLDEDEGARFEAAFDAGDEEAFVHLFGPEKIAEVVGEFLDYFMVHKVMAGEELLRVAGTVTKKLAKWMAANGYLDAEAAGEAVERGASAAVTCPEPSACPVCCTNTQSASPRETTSTPRTRSWRTLRHRASGARSPVAHRWHRSGQCRHEGELARPPGMVGVPRLVAVT